MAGFILIHGYVLWFVWTFFGMFQISTNRYLKHHWEKHLWWHRVSGLTLLVATLYFAGRALYMIGFPLKDDVHAPIGFAVLLAILFITISGVVARSRLNRATSGMAAVHKFKSTHRVLGYLMLIVANLTVSFGIYSYSVNHGFSTNLYWFSFLFFALLWLVLEIRHRVFLSEQPIPFKEPTESMTPADFEY